MTDDIHPKIKAAVLETIETCAQIALEEEHGGIGQTIANKILGLAVYAEDRLAGNYMVRDGISKADAMEIAAAVRGVLAP